MGFLKLNYSYLQAHVPTDQTKVLVLIISILLVTFIVIFAGLLRNSRNMFLFLVSLEFISITIIFIFVTFGVLWGSPDAQIYAIFGIAIAASEAVVGFSLIIKFYGITLTSSLKRLNLLRG